MRDPKIFDLDKTTRVLEKNKLKTKHLDLWALKFSRLRYSAPVRGVNCYLTLSQYVRLAIRAGLNSPNQIGCRSEQYNMSRVGDAGDYEWGNCRFLTTSDNHLEKFENGGYARAAEKTRSRTAEQSARVKAKLVAKLSKDFVLYSPEGRKHTGANLKLFAHEHGLNQGAMSEVCRGKRDHHKGWTGRYRVV